MTTSTAAAATPSGPLARPPARPTVTIAVATAAALVSFGVIGLWAGHGGAASVTGDAVVIDSGAGQVVVHPGDVAANVAGDALAPGGAALPDGWPAEVLPAAFTVRSTGAVGNLLVVSGTLRSADVESWTSGLVGVWRVTGRSSSVNDAGVVVQRLTLWGGGVITVQGGDPALVEVMLPR